jgi:hypothetical protein
MSAKRGFVVLVLWVAVAALPELAVAQTRRFDLPLRVGQRVRITTDDGSKTEGTVIRLTPASVEIGDGGVTRASLAVADVRRIQTADSVKNGVVIGAVSLGLVGGLIATVGAAYGELFDSASTGSPYDIGAGPFLIGAAAGATVGGLLGQVIDGARVKTIYTRPAAGITFHAGPILSNAGRGVGVRVTW